MAFLYDFFPVLLFFVAYKWQGFFVATAVFIAASIAQIAFHWVRKREFKPMHLISAGLVVVFGGITLFLHDEQFLKWKVTIVEWLFAIGFLASAWVGERKTVVERLLGGEITLPAAVWRRLNLMWVAFFFSVGAINLYIMFNFDTEAWVNFKFYGMIGLTIVFVLLQGVYLARHVSFEEK